jgi:hypothetical protein
LLFAAAADTAVAQTVTANGTSGPIAINRGDTVTINTVRGGTATTTDWVAIHAVGAPNNQYLNWYYLNGEKTVPATAYSTASFTFKVNQPPGNYEFRYFANNQSSNWLATSGSVTVSSALTRTVPWRRRLQPRNHRHYRSGSR